MTKTTVQEEHEYSKQVKLNSLIQKRDKLKVQVVELASLNYAREPEFVRDRLRSRELIGELNALKVHITIKHLRPLLKRLNLIQDKLTNETRECEDASEQLAAQYLDSRLEHDEFLTSYIEKRKEAIKRRALVDRFTKERASIEANIPKLDNAESSYSYSPKPAIRQRRRVSLNLPTNGKS